MGPGEKAQRILQCHHGNNMHWPCLASDYRSVAVGKLTSDTFIQLCGLSWNLKTSSKTKKCKKYFTFARETITMVPCTCLSLNESPYVGLVFPTSCKYVQVYTMAANKSIHVFFSSWKLTCPSSSLYWSSCFPSSPRSHWWSALSWAAAAGSSA